MRRRRGVRGALALGIGFLLTPGLTTGVVADGGDVQLDFVAAAPFTYDHATGGGFYDFRTIGTNKDVVESLEGGDFACGDIVTFLTQVRVDSGATGAQTIEIDYMFLADTTGQSGGALVPVGLSVIPVSINYNPQALVPHPIDFGILDDGGSSVPNAPVGWVFSAPPFTKGATFGTRVQIDDLEAGETVVLRLDVEIACNGGSPTGNLQAWVSGARVIAPASEAGRIRVGNQTVPFKHINRLEPCEGEGCEPPPCEGEGCGETPGGETPGGETPGGETPGGEQPE